LARCGLDLVGFFGIVARYIAFIDSRSITHPDERAATRPYAKQSGTVNVRIHFISGDYTANTGGNEEKAEAYAQTHFSALCER
jgi:hypothetical protein